MLDVYEARRRLGGRLPKTPLLPSPWLSSIADGSVFLKIESINLTNSFKIRGALNAALRMSEGIDAPTPTIVTASAGNHGRALALATEELGLACVVFTPASAPDAKKNAIRRHGAVLHSDCEDYDAAEKQAREFAEREGGTLHLALQRPRRDRRRRERSVSRSSRRCRTFDVVVDSSRRRRARKRDGTGDQGRGARARPSSASKSRHRLRSR